MKNYIIDFNKLQSIGNKYSRINALNKSSSNRNQKKEDLYKLNNIIYNIFYKVIYKKDLRSDEPIFEMGDSILVTKVIMYLKDILHVELSIQIIFNNPSVDALTNYIYYNKQYNIAVDMSKQIYKEIKNDGK